MKLNLPLALVFGICSTFALLAQAPQQGMPQGDQTAPATQDAKAHHDPDQQANHLGKKLGLSSDQVAQIRPILANQMQQMQALRDDTSLKPRDRRAKAMSMRQDSDNKIRAVLSDSQKQQYDQMVQERRDHMKQHRQGKQS